MPWTCGVASNDDFIDALIEVSMLSIVFFMSMTDSSWSTDWALGGAAWAANERASVQAMRRRRMAVGVGTTGPQCRPSGERPAREPRTSM